MKTCKKHIDAPAHVYRECVGCELQALRDEVSRLNELSRSAPADKGQGEPVLQWSDDDGLTWMDGKENEMASARCAGWKTRTLYRHPAEQPAPVAAMLPERMPVPDADCPERTNAQGWNACLDEVARLNGRTK